MLFEKQLQNHIARKGRADGIMYFGRQSAFISGEIVVADNKAAISSRYRFKMEPDQLNSLFFSEEYSDYCLQTQHNGDTVWDTKQINSGGSVESKLPDIAKSAQTDNLKSFFKSFKIFHFQDTSDSSKLKGFCNTTDYEYLVEDGSNLPAFLYRMQETAPKIFKMLEYAVKSIAPFIDSLYLQPDAINQNQIELRWKEKGYDNLFNAYVLSDGTLRFICICALLLQPKPPSIIIIDEPELGLHPAAISKLAALMQSLRTQTQIIVATQSVTLVNEFSANDIIVVERKNGNTIFKRQSEESLEIWLSEYSLGELWLKNVLGGKPK